MSTTYSSLQNTFVAQTLNTSLEGAYDDTTGYVTVRVWVNTPANCNLLIYYADSATGTNQVSETYPVYGQHVSSIHSLVKKRYAKIRLLNVTPTVPQTNVLVRTKFATRSVHPFLNYSTDDVTANVTVALEDITVTPQQIDHSGYSIQVYGRTDPTDTSAQADKLAHRPIRTDNCGNITITAVDASGLIIRPAIGAVFKIDASAADGLTVKPGEGTVFKIDASAADGLTVKPGAGAVFKIDASAADGLTVKPGAGTVFKIDASAADGLMVKQGINSVFKVDMSASTVLQAAKGYSIILGNNVVQVGTNINNVYSINLFNANATGTFYVKFYKTTTPSQETTDPLLNFIVKDTQRDLTFPRGIKIGGPLSFLVSTAIGKVVSTDIPDPGVQITITYD